MLYQLKPYLLVISLALITLCAWSTSSMAETYQLQVGDEIDISIFNEPDLSHSYVVSADGSIVMPLIGEIQIAGRTIAQARADIERQYEDGYLINPIIKIEVTSYDPIYIMGEVHNPGQYAFKPNLSALQAIALAGGYTYRANKKHLRLKTGDDLQDKINPTYTVKPGDTLIVKERFF